MKRPAVVIVLLLMSLWESPAAGPPRQNSRPGLGLALSGGGARGLAHVGVLEWFEAQRIPVDHIAGTSMGGLIGGLYAMGMDAAQIRRVIEGLDWDALLAPLPPYRDLTLRRRQDREDYAGTLQLGLKNGLSTSAALMSEHEIRLLLDRLALPYGELETFDDLPIPYRAVAVDLATGERVVMGEGSLSMALQATMTIPGVFLPVVDRGRLLVDGGVLDNLPADEVQAMGAELVVAVDVGTPLRDREDLTSFFAVLDQTIGIMMLDRVRQSRQAADVLLTPELEDFSALDYDQAPAIIEAGRQAAESRRRILSGLSLSQPEWDAHLRQRRSRRRTAVPSPEAVIVSAPEDRVGHEIARQLEPRLGRQLDVAALEDTLDHIRGEGRLARLGYRVGRRNGREVLLVDARQKSHGPPFIDLAVTADNTETDDVSFTVGGRLTFLDAGRYGAEWRTDVSVGSRLGIFSEYYYPVGGGFFLAPRLALDRTTVNLFQASERLAEYKTSAVGGGFDLGWGVGQRRDEVRVGVILNRGDGELRIGDPLLPDVSGRVLAARIGWRHDELDEGVVPTRGWALDWSAGWYFDSPGAAESFARSELRLSGFVPLTGSGSLVLRAAGGTTFENEAPPLQQFTLGGPFRLGGLGAGELRGSRYLLFSSGYRHRVAALPTLVGGAVHLSGWYEVGSVFEPGQAPDYVHSGSIGVITETLVGPIFFGGSWAEAGRTKLYISVGRVF